MIDRTAKDVGSVPEIPEGIYYSVENDNFYRLDTQHGQGNDFYSKWQARRDEFPQGQWTGKMFSVVAGKGFLAHYHHGKFTGQLRMEPRESTNFWDGIPTDGPSDQAMSEDYNRGYSETTVAWVDPVMGLGFSDPDAPIRHYSQRAYDLAQPGFDKLATDIRAMPPSKHWKARLTRFWRWFTNISWRPYA